MVSGKFFRPIPIDKLRPQFFVVGWNTVTELRQSGKLTRVNLPESFILIKKGQKHNKVHFWVMLFSGKLGRYDFHHSVDTF